MALMTRPDFPRNYGMHPSGYGMSVPAANGWTRRPILRGGAQSLHVPPTSIAMDPTRPETWVRPVRWT